MAHNSSVPCYPVREAVSNGVLQGDIPVKFALPLLIIQVTIVLVVTRTMAYLFKPFRQPRVLAEVIGGVLLGPSGLGRSKAYMQTIFPPNSLTLIDTVATLGLLFFLFMVGLELDLKEIRKSGKTALMVAMAGITMPFVGGIGIASLIREPLGLDAKFAPLVVFMGVPLSITAFPVLVRIMAERKLLTTDLGKTVIPAAAINDVIAWILLAVGVALSGPSTSPATPAYVLLSGLGFVLFMLFVMKRFMEWIAHRASTQENVSEIYVCITMMGVLLSGFTTDFIGIHPLFGAFVFGLIVPKEGNFAQMLIEKIEDFITVLMLPLFFASSGLKTNLGTINSAKSFGFLALLIVTAMFGKLSGTVAAALSLKLPLNEAFAFGFLMNTKGLVELIVLNIGKDLHIFNDQAFAILVLMCLFLMFFTTPAVVALYKPARTPVPYVNRKLEGSSSKKDQLRILACIHGTRTIPGLLNLVEACRGSSKKRPLKLFAMHLIELTDRTSSLMTLSRTRSEQTKKRANEDNALVAFEAYGRVSKVPVRFLTAVSDMSNMHYDVCNSAAERRATVIVVPANIYQKEDGTIEHVNSGLRAFNQRILQHAPCTVCILVDRGLWGSERLLESPNSQKVAVMFFGGPDDREALAMGNRLAEHANVQLWVIRFKPSDSEMQNHIISIASDTDDEKCDEESLAAVKKFSKECKESGKIQYEEHSYGNPTEAVIAIAKSSAFSLLLVGRGHTRVALSATLERQGEASELGLIGDALANAGHELKSSSVLVIQQHKSTNLDTNGSSTQKHG